MVAVRGALLLTAEHLRDFPRFALDLAPDRFGIATIPQTTIPRGSASFGFHFAANLFGAALRSILSACFHLLLSQSAGAVVVNSVRRLCRQR
jgi:hypothetical protein